MKVFINENQTRGFTGAQYSIEVRLELTSEQVALLTQYKVLDIDIGITEQTNCRVRQFISGFKLTEGNLSAYSSLRHDCIMACQKVKALVEICGRFGNQQVIDLD